MKKNVIVSLADSNYFELLNELVDSIKSFEQSKDTAICILDAGLSEQQKKILSKKVDEIKSAEWDIDVPAFKVKGREWLKSQVSRAFLPKYFPNYKKYISSVIGTNIDAQQIKVHQCIINVMNYGDFAQFYP